MVHGRFVLRLLLMVLLLWQTLPTHAADPVAIGSRLELMVDDYLIERLEGGATRRLHHPIARDVAMVTDPPWEGNACHYRTVFADDGEYRMYYSANHYPVGQLVNPRKSKGPVLALATSSDGIQWNRPELRLVLFEQSTANNIVLDEKTAPVPPGYSISEMGVTVFKDKNPQASPDARYKAVAICRRTGQRHNAGLLVYKSPDGLRWSLMHDKPVITQGNFDSQNLAFFDEHRGEYRAYWRVSINGLRQIRTATSRDFISWSEPKLVTYSDGHPHAMYTNQIQPYPRAPHLLMGFPMRYNHRLVTPSMTALPRPEHREARRQQSRRYGEVVTDALFMVSRDGVHFTRYSEAFLRPAAAEDGWVYGDNSIAWGMAITPSHLDPKRPELSFYVTEGYWTDDAMKVRRYTLRLDGFVSIHTPFEGGEMVTRPLTFTGSQLALNFATSGAGAIRVELQTAAGEPIPGYTLDDCLELYGDDVAQVVHWKSGNDVSSLAGQAIRIRFVMNDSDLYALQFKP